MHRRQIIGGFSSGPVAVSTFIWGRTLFVPSLGLLSTPDTKDTGYERTTNGNQLRPVNPSSTRGSAPAPHGPRAVVVCADATGRGSRFGLRSPDTVQTAASF